MLKFKKKNYSSSEISSLFGDFRFNKMSHYSTNKQIGITLEILIFNHYTNIYSFHI